MSDDPDEAVVASPAELAMRTLVGAAEDFLALEEAFAGDYPEQWGEYQDLRARIPHLISAAKDAIRQDGRRGAVVLAGQKVTTSVPKVTVVDAEGVANLAAVRREVSTLLAAGVLGYTCDASRIAALPQGLQAVYSQFVTTTSGTMRVSLPRELTKLVGKPTGRSDEEGAE